MPYPGGMRLVFKRDSLSWPRASAGITLRGFGAFLFCLSCLTNIITDNAKTPNLSGSALPL